METRREIGLATIDGALNRESGYNFTQMTQRDNPAITWSSASLTDRGVRRQHNEDALLDSPEKGIWAVADGMGGHTRGDLASSTVIEQLGKIPSRENLEEMARAVRDTLGSINSDLVAIARKHKSLIIGSTIVTLIAGRDGQFACLWAGDSRLYLLQNGELRQATKDHSEVQALVDRGIVKPEMAENHPAANVINRAIGAESRLDVDIVFGSLRPGDKCLLCSDGLYRELFEQEIFQTLNKLAEPEAIVAELAGLALRRGARDNVSVVAVVVDS